MHPFIDFLKQRLNRDLPGRDAQFKMAPKPVSEGPSRKMNPPGTYSDSSVLIVLFPNSEGDLELVLTLRSKNIDHGGQLSFPGGRSDDGETVVDTALREAEEEVGIPPENVEILGSLSTLYVDHSRNQVTPIVGYLQHQPNLILNPAEVEEAFTVELDSLVNKKNLTVEQWDLRDHTYHVPYWDVHRVPLWGATAMMLSEFLEIYREFLGDRLKSQ